MGKYDDDSIVTLQNANGDNIDFVEIAGIAYGGNFYAILQPVDLPDGMDDTEALVFRVNRGKGGNNHFDIETDDKIIDAVFKEYNRLLDEQEKNRGPKANQGGQKSAGGKRMKKRKLFQPLLFAVVLFVLAIVSSSLRWGTLVTSLLFVGAFGCVIWFVLPIIIYFAKKAKKK